MLRALGEYTIVNVSDGQNGTPGAEGPQGEKGDDGSSFHWNMLKNTDDLTKWSRESGVTCTSSSDGWYKVTDNTHTSSRWGIYQNVSVAPSTTYSISVWAKNEARLSVSFVDTVGWGSEVGYSGSGEALLKYTFTTTEACSTVRVYLNFYPTDNLKECYFKRPKLEIGKTISDWCGTYEEQHGASAEAVVEYALIIDGGDISSATWSTIVPEFLVGYSYWRRVRTIWSDGRADSFSTPQRDDVLTGAMLSYANFSFQMSSSVFIRNLRDKASFTTISFLPRVSGYGLIETAFVVDGVETASSFISISYTDTRDVINVYMKAEYLGSSIHTDVQVLTCVDETVPPFYLGPMASAPTDANGLNLIKGDWYFNSSESKTYVYTDTGVWKVIEPEDENFSEMALSTLSDKFSSALDMTGEVLAENIFVKNLISSFVTAAYIAAKDIELLPGGALRSKGYSKGTVAKLIKGEALDAGAPEKGFHLDTDGNAEFYKANMYEAVINKGTLNAVSVNGELNADTFATLKAETVSSAHRAVAITGGNAYWCESDIIAALKSAESSIGNVLSCSGSYYGSSITYCLYLLSAELTKARVVFNYSGITTYQTFNKRGVAIKRNYYFQTRNATFRTETICGVMEFSRSWYYSINGSSYTLMPSSLTLSCDGNPYISVKTSTDDEMIPANAQIFSSLIRSFYRDSFWGKAFVNYNTSDTNGNVLYVGENYTARFPLDLSTAEFVENSISYKTSCAGIAYGNGSIVILDEASDLATSPTTYISSNGGRSYTAYNTKGSVSRDDAWVALIYFNSYFYAFHCTGLGMTENKVSRSSDGKTWTSVTGFTIEPVRDGYNQAFIQVLNTLYTIRVENSSSGYDFYLAKTTDLSTWSDASKITTLSAYPNYKPTIVFSSKFGRFYASIGTDIFTSSDGVTWTTVYNSYGSDNAITVLPGNTLGYVDISANNTSANIIKAERVTTNHCAILSDSAIYGYYTFSDLHEGWNFFSSANDFLGYISPNTKRMLSASDAFSITCSGLTFNSANANRYYKYRGIEKLVGSSYQAISSGIASKIDQASAPAFSFKKLGESSVTTVTASSIKSITWDENSLNVITDTKTYTITLTEFLASLTLTFTPIGRVRGNYTESIYPEESESARASDIDLGSVGNKFNHVYAKTLHGALDGNASTASKASIVIDAGDGRSLTLSYSKAGLSSNPTWVAAWNSNELRAVAPSVLSVGYAASAGSASKADSATKANSADSAKKATSADSATKAYWA